MIDSPALRGFADTLFVWVLVLFLLFFAVRVQATTFVDYTTNGGDYAIIETNGVGFLSIPCKKLEIGDIDTFIFDAQKNSSGTTSYEIFINGVEASTYYKAGTSQGSADVDISGDAEYEYKATWSTPVYCRDQAATLVIACSGTCNGTRFYLAHDGIWKGTRSILPFWVDDNSFSTAPVNNHNSNTLSLRLDGTSATTSESGGGTTVDTSVIEEYLLGIYYVILVYVAFVLFAEALNGSLWLIRRFWA